ncbi:NAD(P)H-dependent oxidoreductase [Modestobacter sp. VKM Ac-2983]|uniref:FMN-dependent NADH-azoreductase n=1 Tax=Modestobacter sp. VKM Ac-2983 TaxID=3004137 RepID=UPI0022ABB157|nr:NAD(P)H-dependent oxidoreductase [Modestobacter sp. VKM Ac-2983]MCZ2807034.1 NAD(P)H-dependent oxidoreductase [Modestobacter sp. VKM Ac-2983]
MSLFRLDASIRVEGSASREIADIVEREWRAGNPDAPVTRRHIGTEPLPADAWGAAVAGSYLPAEQRTPEQTGALALATTLTDELVDAEALLFAVPLYNFGVSQHVKTWVDLVITDPRMGPRAEPPLAGKPAVLAVVRGGNYSAGTPREGWDHATSWLRRILADVWQLDLRVVERDFTLVGVNPALDSFTELAAELKATAEREAAEHGRLLSSTRVAA